MNYREKIRKAIECPQLGNETYGELGILNLTQRKYIKRLLDELDNADNFVKKLYFENKQLKIQISAREEVCNRLESNWNKLKECLKDVMNSCDDDDKDFVETILDIMQELEQGSD